MSNRTNLNKEFGYKEPVPRKKECFSLQWFRYMSACLSLADISVIW